MWYNIDMEIGRGFPFSTKRQPHPSANLQPTGYNRLEYTMHTMICQIVSFNADGTTEGKRLTLCNSLADAYRNESRTTPRGSFRVYPFCDRSDGDSIMDFAEYAARQKAAWLVCNDSAGADAVNKPAYDYEDMRQDAAGYVLACDNAADMRDLLLAALRGIDRERRAMYPATGRDASYNPAWAACNVCDRIASATFPALNKLVSDCLPRLTDAEQEAVEMFASGTTKQDIADLAGISRRSVRGRIDNGLFTLLRYMDAHKDANAAFASAGISKADRLAALAVLAEKNKDIPRDRAAAYAAAAREAAAAPAPAPVPAPAPAPVPAPAPAADHADRPALLRITWATAIPLN